jgi:hypothetical protein
VNIKRSFTAARFAAATAILLSAQPSQSDARAMTLVQNFDVALREAMPGRFAVRAGGRAVANAIRRSVPSAGRRRSCRRARFCRPSARPAFP